VIGVVDFTTQPLGDLSSLADIGPGIFAICRTSVTLHNDKRLFSVEACNEITWSNLL